MYERMWKLNSEIIYDISENKELGIPNSCTISVFENELNIYTSDNKLNTADLLCTMFLDDITKASKHNVYKTRMSIRSLVFKDKEVMFRYPIEVYEKIGGYYGN